MSLSKSRPEFEMCCVHRKVSLPPLCMLPLPLANFFILQTQEGNDFHKNIMQYNAALAFTSLGVKIDHSIVGCGLPVFCIHGELTHLTGSLLPPDNVHLSYSQLYIYDPHAAFGYRVSQNENLSLNTMVVLQQLMRTCNAYTPLYQHAYEVLQGYNAPDYSIKLCVLPGNDQQ